MTDASLFEYSWLYADEIKTAEGNRLVDRIITFSVFVADGALALFLLLFVAAKKPVLIIVFSLLGALSYWLTWVDFNMRGLLEDRYALSVSFYLTIACLVVLLVGAIWLLANKKKLKKQVKTAE